MTDQQAEDQAQSESPLKRLLRAATSSGIDWANDPVNAGLPDLVSRVTTIYSRWYARTCLACYDRFREGDRVRLCPRCHEAYHDDAQSGLHCWEKRFQSGGRCGAVVGDARAGIVAGGAAALLDCCYTWDGRLPREPSHRAAQDGSSRESPPALLVSQFFRGLEMYWRPYGERPMIRVTPASGLVGRKCPLCRFRVRAGDWVVACPCGCGTYIHQDVFRHLTCWNEWNGVEGNDYCPNTGRPFPEGAGR